MAPRRLTPQAASWCLSPVGSDCQMRQRLILLRLWTLCQSWQMSLSITPPSDSIQSDIPVHHTCWHRRPSPQTTRIRHLSGTSQTPNSIPETFADDRTGDKLRVIEGDEVACNILFPGWVCFICPSRKVLRYSWSKP